MTQQELDWIKDNFAASGKQNIDRIAEGQVLLEVISDVICQMTGREDVSAVRDEIRAKIRRRQEEYLLKVEDMYPGLAAQMDNDRPLLPPSNE